MALEQNDINITNSDISGGDEEPKAKQPKPWWRKLLLGIAWTVAGLVAFIVLLTVLLYVPPVQNWVVQTATKQLRSTIGYDVEIGRIRIGFPMKLHIEEVRAFDLMTRDTVASMGLLTAQVSLWPVIQGEEVPISGVELSSLRLNYSAPNDSLALRGWLNEVKLNQLRYSIANSTLQARDLALKGADVSIAVLVDTLKEKQESTPSSLVLFFESATIEDVSAKVFLNPDTALVDATVHSALFRGGEVNLMESYYQVKEVEIDAWLGTVGAKIDFLPYPWVVKLSGNDVRYGGAHDLKASVNELYFEGGDGWRVTEGQLFAYKDSTDFLLQNFALKLQNSYLRGAASLPFNGWLPDSTGLVEVALDGVIYPLEVQRFLGKVERVPVEPLSLQLSGNGYIDRQVALKLDVRNPDILTLQLDAMAHQVMSPSARHITGDYHLATEEGVQPLVASLVSSQGKAPSWRIPAGVYLDGTASYTPWQMGSHLQLESEEGGMEATLSYAPRRKSYKAQLKIDQLNLAQFLPKDSLGVVTAVAQLEGQGTDIYSNRTVAHALVKVDSLQYKEKNFEDITLLTQLKDHLLFAAIDSEDRDVNFTAQIDAQIKRNDLIGSVNFYVDTLIPSAVGIASPVVLGSKFELRSNIRSDLKEYYDFYGEVENFALQTNKGLLSPTNSYVIAQTSDKKLSAEVTSGDLSLKVDVQNGLKDFTERLNLLAQEVQRSLVDSLGVIDMAPWIAHYPTLDIALSMGRNNALRYYLDEYRVGVQSLSFHLQTTTSEGLRGQGVVTNFQTDTFRINTMDLVLMQDSAFFYAFATAQKERFRNQLPFTIIASVTSNVARSEAYLHWIDHKEKSFMQMGLEVASRRNGDLVFGFTPDPITLFHNNFTVQPNNHVILPAVDRRRIGADLLLTSNDGSTIALKDTNLVDQHHLIANIKDLELSSISGVSFLPDIKGVLQADFQWQQNLLPNGKVGNEQAYLGSVGVNDFVFQRKHLGDLHVEGEMTNNDRGSSIVADALVDGVHVAHATTYQAKGTPSDERRVAIDVHDLSIDRANPFLPEKYAKLSGLLAATISNYERSQEIELAPIIPYVGEITFKDAYVTVPLANESYHLDNRPIYLRDGVARLDNYRLSANNAHLTIDGTAALSSGFPLNLHIRGNDLNLLNSTPTDTTIVYGRVNADADIKVVGPVSGLSIDGAVSIKGNTDVTYQSKQSELRSRNQYKGLVEFTDFTDTLFVAKREKIDSLSLSGHDIHLAISIDPATQVNAIFSRDEQNRLYVQGGGVLNLAMPAYGPMSLSGTYAMREGQIFLNYPPIVRRFRINDGSQITWSGAVMEPRLDFTATSRIRSNVNIAGESQRSVDFDVTIIAENRLDDLRLRFATSAPNDVSLQNRLAALTPEEQNRQSLMLLTTGMYMGGESSPQVTGFDVNSALTSTLAGQLNSLFGEALDAEINFGIDNRVTPAGMDTSYSYSIAKRFYDNRINVIIGGKVMTGQETMGMRQSFIDNMSIEYRLDRAGSHYLRLFHQRNFENFLDGEVIESGLGYIIRRRLYRLGDLFIFRRRAQQATEPVDNTTTIEQNEHETTAQ